MAKESQQTSGSGSLHPVVGRRFRRAGDRGTSTVLSVADDDHYLLMQEANGRRFKVSIAGLARNWIEEDEPSNDKAQRPPTTDV